MAPNDDSGGKDESTKTVDRAKLHKALNESVDKEEILARVNAQVLAQAHDEGTAQVDRGAVERYLEAARSGEFDVDALAAAASEAEHGADVQPAAEVDAVFASDQRDKTGPSAAIFKRGKSQTSKSALPKLKLPPLGPPKKGSTAEAATDPLEAVLGAAVEAAMEAADVAPVDVAPADAAPDVAPADAAGTDARQPGLQPPPSGVVPPVGRPISGEAELEPTDADADPSEPIDDGIAPQRASDKIRVVEIDAIEQLWERAPTEPALDADDITERPVGLISRWWWLLVLAVFGLLVGGGLALGWLLLN